MGSPVKSRLVLSFPGFEPVPVEAHRRRFEREGAKAAAAYGITMEVGEAEITRGPVDIGIFSVLARGDGWKTRTEFVFYGLATLNAMYDERPFSTRILKGLQGYADYILSGAFFRYGQVAWRYLVFVLYPVLLLMAALFAGMGIIWLTDTLWPSRPDILPWLTVFGVIVAIFWIAGKRLHLMLFIDDWSFSRDFVRSMNPVVEDKLAYVFRDMQERVRNNQSEEILVAAHSFGAPTAILSLAETLKEVKTDTQIGLLTAGSSLMKFALHPAGNRFRDAVNMIVSANTPWLDVQALVDPLHCYGSDPARMFSENATERQKTRSVRFRHQLSPESYKAMRGDIYRVHRQFVYGVEKRSPYSFHMITAGPEPFGDIVTRSAIAPQWNYQEKDI